MGEVNEAFEEELLDCDEEDEKAPELNGKPTGDSARKSYVRIHSLGFRDFLSKPELLRATVDSGFEHPSEDLEEEDAAVAALPIKNKKGNKKRAACDPAVADTENLGDIVLVGHEGKVNGAQIDDVINEPTMGEKLANLYLQDKNGIKNIENEESSQLIKPPSADSVHVLMKQALRADDQTLLLNCLHTQDDKVIINSVALLGPSDVLKLLDSLISMVHSRGAVLVHALPWLRSLLLQHASSIMSQESSLLALNSLYQLIESRVSTFVPALQLSSHLDLLYKGTLDDGIEENDTITPVIFEDKDESEEEEEEEESDDGMGNGGDDEEPFDDDSDIDEMNFG